MLKTSRVWLSSFATVVASGIAGCGEGAATGPGQLIKTVGDRTVIATLDPAGELTIEGDTAVVTASGVKVTIEKDKVLIDGNDSGVIPATAKRVDVTIVAGTLTVNADDAPIATKAVKSKDAK